ncbi:Uncharacterised protein r2_g2065 [Pycnogonum litorale]
MSDHDRSRRFVLWMDEFNSYLDAVREIDDSRKRALFMYCAGPSLKRFVETHRYKSNSYIELVGLIEAGFSSPSTLSFNRYKLAETMQNSGETTDDFVSRLRLQARFCNFRYSFV